MASDDRGIPVTEKQWIRLIRECRKPRNTGAIRKAQYTVWQAMEMPASSRTDVQRMAIREWKYPDWVPMDQRHQSRPPATVPRPVGGNQQPDMDCTPEAWAQWLTLHPTECPPGIIRRWDGSLSLRELRGMIFISRRAPKKEKKPKGFKGDSNESSVEHRRSAYKLTAVSLFAIPGQYAAQVQLLGCAIVNREGELTRYDGPVDNLTTNDLT
jgi:hypothetical protein